MRALLLILALAACSAPPPGQDAAAPRGAAPEPQVRPDINASYLSPDLDVDDLAEGFSAESREVFAAREAVTAALGIAPGDAVADIGAGTGIHLAPFDAAVGPGGTVYAVDISEKLVEYLEDVAARDGFATVKAVLGEGATTTLPPASLDLAFTSNVYHHFERPAAMNAHLFEAVRPGGRYAILDFRRAGARDWVQRHVRADMATVIEEVSAAGFVFRGELPVAGLEDNYLIVFERP